MKESFSMRVKRGYSIGCKVLSIMRTRLTIGLLISMCLAQSALGEDVKFIASFEKPDSERNWISVNDGVMGGLSEGSFRRTERKTLLFTGSLSLENNGGFASIRTGPGPMDLAGTSGIVVKARGDGRTYWVDLRTARQFGASSYRAFLPTSKDAFKETFIPFSDFKLQRFGQQVSAWSVDPAAIVAVGFTLSDKQAGPFELEIEYIKTFSKDGGSKESDFDGTIVDAAAAAGNFRTLLAAAGAAGLSEALSEGGPFTLFAPTDDAFSRLPAGILEDLLRPENKQELEEILKYHVIAHRMTLAEALDVGEVNTLQGGNLPVKFEDGRVLIGSATLIRADIAASNGIIHVIDQVLLPPEASTQALTPAALIVLAIDRGVPLFNNGNPGACAAVYEVTCEALRVMPGVSEDSRLDLARALSTMREARTDHEKAWILRYALDGVLSHQREGK
jgi:uncharacterized surface protein with fasciclin (FAS1) repeats